jgi:hypothetical protein
MGRLDSKEEKGRRPPFSLSKMLLAAIAWYLAIMVAIIAAIEFFLRGAG